MKAYNVSCRGNDIGEIPDAGNTELASLDGFSGASN